MSQRPVPGPSNPIIRTYQLVDAEPLAALLRAGLANGEQHGNTSEVFEALIGAFPIVRNLLVAEVDGVAAGVISPDHHLLQVDPAFRRQGIGRSLVEAAEAALDTTDDGPLILYQPHGNAGAIAFLTEIGYGYDHSLWRFELRDTSERPLPELAANLTLRTYEDSMLDAYVDLIDASFADHVTPLRVTGDQIQHVHASPNFDPAGIAVVSDATGDLIGFCTTGANRNLDPPSGSVRLLGVRPDHRRYGLGRWLLQWGIDYLRSTGVDAIELLVESQNERALQLYRSAGFEPVEEWPQWTRKHASEPLPVTPPLSGN